MTEPAVSIFDKVPMDVTMGEWIGIISFIVIVLFALWVGGDR